MPDVPRGANDPITDPAILDALIDFKDPAGFFSPAQDPDRLDSELQELYVGMSAEDAASAAVGDGITEIRVFRLPFDRAYRKDHIPNRLNLAVLDGRVIRVAFF
jgi:hypothetical protein